MRSRAARLALSAVSWIALGAAAFFLFQSEKQIVNRRTAIQAFDRQAREAGRTLAELRAAQQAYVAAGQGLEFWIPKVASLVSDASQAVDQLRASAESPIARASLMEAAATILEFGNVDRRARNYLALDQRLMATDVVFTEGGETAVRASQQVEAAQVAENQKFDASEAAGRWRQAYVLGGAALLAGLLAAPLVVMRAGRAGPTLSRMAAPAVDAAPGRLVEKGPRTEGPSATERGRRSVPRLRAAAELCTELGRANDLEHLTTLLGRAAELMDASGLVVWIGNAAGADLRPALTHGYSPQTLARMPAVARTADNAAAAAYRTGALQVVLARPGISNGALVAPLLLPDGCVGALTAEIRSGGETSDSAQALATILAAQLASVLASSVLPVSDAGAGRSASA